MHSAKLRELHQARPFHPFFIRLADGRSVSVTHPEWMSLSPSGRVAVVHQKDDRMNIIDVLLVTDLEIKPNGKTKAQK